MRGERQEVREYYFEREREREGEREREREKERGRKVRDEIFDI